VANPKPPIIPAKADAPFTPKPPGAPGSAPRSITPFVRGRIWLEPVVRLWWLSALVVLGIAIEIGVTEFLGWRADVDLTQHGVVVEAMVGGIPGTTRPPNEDLNLTFTLNGTQYQVVGVLEGRTDYVPQAKPVTIRVDPTDPTRWTYRTEAPPIGQYLLGPALALGMFLIAVCFCWREWQRVAKIYRRGEAVAVTVVGVGPSPLAPRSKRIQYTRYGSSDKRVRWAIVPIYTTPAVAPGDMLWLLCLSAKPDRAIAAIRFTHEAS